MIEHLLSPKFWETIVDQVVAWSVRSLPAVLLVLILAAITLRLMRGLLNRLKPRMVEHLLQDGESDSTEVQKRVDTLFGIVLAVLRVAIWLVALMLVLRNVGVDIGPILAGAGVIGLAVGFGAQEMVRDVISGFFMLLENHVRTGDVVLVNGTGGLVERVGLRTIVLRDLSGTVHVFQNGKVNTLANMTKEWSAMVFDVGVAYDSNTDQVVDVMKKVAADLKEDPELGSLILEDMEVFGVDAFGASEIVIKGRLKTKPIQQWTIGREYRRRLKLAFDEAGIEIPFPQRTLWLKGEPQLVEKK